MTRTDRVLLSLLVVALWALVLVVGGDAKPAYGIYIDASDVDGLEDFIEDVVEDCDVSGEVYVYDPEGGYGELESVTIDC
jgi:hypothetical protein